MIGEKQVLGKLVGYIFIDKELKKKYYSFDKCDDELGKLGVV